MPRLIFITHPEVDINPETEIAEWGLAEKGRHRASVFARSDVFANVTHIWSSAERKGRETAALLAAPKLIPVFVDARLGENDRSATGFLPPPEFEAAADAFFAQPHASTRGWERAVDAQARIDAAVRDIVTDHAAGDLAIVSHGAVGTLLWCSLRGVPIDRRHDQPSQGHFWCADITTLHPDTGWRPIS